MTPCTYGAPSSIGLGMCFPGVAAGDLNRDGFIDLVVQGGLGQNASVFINNGDGTFTDLAFALGIDLNAVEGSSVSIADVDGNGWLDIYFGTLYAANRLYLNFGSGLMMEAATAAGIALSPPPQGLQLGNTYGAAVGDYDLDGDLDLYTTQWGINTLFGNRLFRNNGSGTFAEVTALAGLTQPANQYFAFAPSFADMDDDRYPEIFVAADFGTSKYFTNDTDGTFSLVAGNGTCTDENGMGSAVGDFDNDGDLDWFVTSIFDDNGSEGGWGISGNRLYRNDGGHQFTDVTDVAGVRNGFWGWGASFADVNHDGWLDLVMTNGYILPLGFNLDPVFETDPARLWINQGNSGKTPTFIEVSRQAGIQHTGAGKGLVTFDADNDGDLDLAMTTNFGDFAFYRNEFADGTPNWMQMDLVPPLGNAPDGIGAVVRVTVNGATLRRDVHTANTFMGHEAARVHVGFPASPTIDRIDIDWPDGSHDVMIDVPAGAFVLGRRGNLNGDHAVDSADVVSLLNQWGACRDTAACAGDLDDDGEVDGADLGILLLNWTGPAPD